MQVFWDLVKFVMCTLETRVYVKYFIVIKGYTVPGNQGTYDKLNQIHFFEGGWYLMIPIEKVFYDDTL